MFRGKDDVDSLAEVVLVDLSRSLEVVIAACYVFVKQHAGWANTRSDLDVVISAENNEVGRAERDVAGAGLGREGERGSPHELVRRST